VKNYVKTYLKYFGFDESDFIPCEDCGARSVEIHHLEPKSIAKAKENLIDNLCAVCRSCHDKAHNSRAFNEELKLIHRKKLLSVNRDNEIEKFLDL
jgi:HNH endonuclease